MGLKENNEILSPYYPFIVEQCAKLFNKGNSIHLDLANEIYLTLTNSDTNLLQSLVNTNKMNGYIYNTIQTQRYSTNSTFFRQYVRNPTHLDLPEQTHNNISFENINRLTDFQKKMLALYIRFGTYDEAAKRSRISKRILIKYIKEIIKIIE